MVKSSCTELLWILSLVSLGGAPAIAQTTVTDTFGVQITINSDCEITSTETLDFGSSGVLTTAVLTTADLQVTCTTGTAYDIRLDEGTGSGATISVRKMTSGGSTINYEMFSDSGRTTNWGETDGVDTVSDTGNGSAQTHTVFGRVPVQTTPAPGTYTDTITVTVAF